MAGQIDLRVASPPAVKGRGRSPGRADRGEGGLDHRLDRHVDLQVQRLRVAGVDDRAVRRGPTMKRPTSSSGFCVALRPMRWGSCRLSSESRSSVSARCCAALGRGHRVDLVDDHRLDPAQHLARLRREDQVQRLGGGDEDVGRRAAHGGAVALRCVAGADRHRDVGADPAQRRAQVAVDVVGQRLQRRDVDQAGMRRRLARQPVQSPEEGGQRLAAPRGGGDEHVLARGDGRPRLLLRGRRGFE